MPWAPTCLEGRAWPGHAGPQGPGATRRKTSKKPHACGLKRHTVPHGPGRAPALAGPCGPMRALGPYMSLGFGWFRHLAPGHALPRRAPAPGCPRAPQGIIRQKTPHACKLKRHIIPPGPGRAPACPGPPGAWVSTCLYVSLGPGHAGPQGPSATRKHMGKIATCMWVKSPYRSPRGPGEPGPARALGLQGPLEPLPPALPPPRAHRQKTNHMPRKPHICGFLLRIARPRELYEKNPHSCGRKPHIIRPGALQSPGPPGP